MKRVHLLSAVAAAVLTGACSSPPDGRRAEFLTDYSKLAAVDDRTARFVDGSAGPYHALMIEPIVIRVPEEHLDASQREELRKHTDGALRGVALAAGYKLSDKPGPGVARVRIAITQVDQSDWWRKLRSGSGAAPAPKTAADPKPAPVAPVAKAADPKPAPAAPVAPVTPVATAATEPKPAPAAPAAPVASAAPAAKAVPAANPAPAAKAAADPKVVPVVMNPKAAPVAVNAPAPKPAPAAANPKAAPAPKPAPGTKDAPVAKDAPAAPAAQNAPTAPTAPTAPAAKAAPAAPVAPVAPAAPVVKEGKPAQPAKVAPAVSAPAPGPVDSGWLTTEAEVLDSTTGKPVGAVVRTFGRGSWTQLTPFQRISETKAAVNRWGGEASQRLIAWREGRRQP